jgi:hypothetical protein
VCKQDCCQAKDAQHVQMVSLYPQTYSAVGSSTCCRFQRMRAAAKVTTSIISRFFKRNIYKNIKANVVTMSNCCRSTIMRRPFMAAHLGFQHAKAHLKMRPLQQRLIAMRQACQCFKGPIFHYLFARRNNAVKSVSAVIRRSGPRQAVCARRDLIISLQAYTRTRIAYVKFYIPLTMAKKLQRSVRRIRAQHDYRRVVGAGLRLRPYILCMQNRVNYEDIKRAVGVIQAVRHFQRQRISYVKCR